MGLFGRLASLFKFEQKNIQPYSVGGQALYAAEVGLYGGSERVYAQQGYQQCLVAYYCINLIAKAVANIPIELYEASGAQVEQHPWLDSLNQPNVWQSYDSWIYQLVTNYLIAGNAYIERVDVGDRCELVQLEPYGLTLTYGAGPVPISYLYSSSRGQQRRYEVDRVNGQITRPDALGGEAKLLHLKTHNPLEPFEGQSPLMAAMSAVNLHNNSLGWNNSLLMRSGVPSGVVTTADGARMAAEQEGQIRDWIREMLTGFRNAGRTVFLPGGLRYEVLGTSPKDMDFTGSLDQATKDIAKAFNIPYPLVIPDAATDNNMSQAYEQLYADEVLPLLAKILNELNRFAQDKYPGYHLRYNDDEVWALEPKRERRRESLNKLAMSGVLTINEVREALGYEPLEAVEEVLEPLPEPTLPDEQ